MCLHLHDKIKINNSLNTDISRFNISDTVLPYFTSVIYLIISLEGLVRIYITLFICPIDRSIPICILSMLAIQNIKFIL